MRVCEPPKPTGWRIIAGPPLTASQFHCATVPDGPNCQWKGGEFERIEAKNQAALRAAEQALKAAEQAEIETNGYFTDPDWREAISPDGVRCFVARIHDTAAPPPVKATPSIPDDLSIPDFLLRARVMS